MTAHIDFTALPDAEAARLMAEMDGWRVESIGEAKVLGNGDRYGMFELQQHGKFVGPYTHEYESDAWRCIPNYPRSLDAAVGWLGRMGLIWQRKAERHDKYWVDVFWGAGAVHCEESDTCPTARALCNAGWAAVQAREAANE